MNHLTTKISSRLSPGVICGIILFLIFGIALLIRIWLAYDRVFADGWVRFVENDPWYHMRLVENLLQHFPHRISFDPYTFYPYGQAVAFAPFFDLLLGFVCWVIGLGSPTPHTIEVVGAYFPAILGALVTIPVYFIGKELFNSKVGLLSAALVAILPTEFLSRSLLGSTDHHVAEVLFSTILILFLILALKRAKEKETSFAHIRNREWRNIGQPLVYALLAGVALGVYLLSWVGGLLFVFVLFAGLVLLYLIEHLRGQSTDYLCIIGVPIFIVALIMTRPFLSQLLFSDLYIMSLVVAMCTFPVLSGISRLMEVRNLKRVYYPLALIVLGFVSLVVFRLIEPSLFHSMLAKLDVLTPNATGLTISEVQPLFSAPGGHWYSPAWTRFTTGCFIAPIAFILITYAVIKKVSAEKVLFLVWSAVMLAAAVGQVRFVYYLTVNVALLSGYFCWRIPGWISVILVWLGFRERPEPKAYDVQMEKKGKAPRGKKGKIQERRERRKAQQRRRQPNIILRNLGPRFVSIALGVIVVFFLAFYPLIGKVESMKKIESGTTDDWHESLLWMRDNTPDPFPDDPNFYYELYTRPATGEAYNYPSSAYGVMSWWDYGHWITDIAHRIPNANPHQAGAVSAAEYFTAQDESSGNAILDRLGSKYVVIDIEMAMAQWKFYAMVLWAGKSESEFFEYYYQYNEETKTYEGILLYYPEYYQSMCSRLYNFGGEKVVPENTTYVIGYDEYKRLTYVERYESYDSYLSSEDFSKVNDGSSNYKLVGVNPFGSPVPLDKLEHYTLIHQSPTTVVNRGTETISEVEIFRYDP